MTNVCEYADDTTFHACGSKLESLIQRSEHDSMLAIEWCESHYKFHVYLAISIK